MRDLPGLSAWNTIKGGGAGPGCPLVGGGPCQGAGVGKSVQHRDDDWGRSGPKIFV